MGTQAYNEDYREMVEDAIDLVCLECGYTEHRCDDCPVTRLAKRVVFNQKEGSRVSKIKTLKVVQGRLKYPLLATPHEEELVNKFNSGELGDLFLDVLPEYQEETIPEILGEGVYQYRTSTNSELESMLYEVAEVGIPVGIGVDDVVIEEQV